MRLCSLASGSSGNSVLIQSERATILIDAGYSAKRIENLLRTVGVHPKKLDAILVTHEHSDHIAGLGVLTRRYHLPIYANENTWLAMEKKVGRHRDRDHVVFRNKQPFQIKDMMILPVPIHHDCADPVGYAIRCGKEKIAVLTDTGIVDTYMLNAMRGADIYYLEANYEDLLLRHGSYSLWSKRRIGRSPKRVVGGTRRRGAFSAHVHQQQYGRMLFAYGIASAHGEWFCCGRACPCPYCATMRTVRFL